MGFIVLESGAVVLTGLVAAEMLRQRRSWQFVLITSLAVLATATLMNVWWRGW